MHTIPVFSHEGEGDHVEVSVEESAQLSPMFVDFGGLSPIDANKLHSISRSEAIDVVIVGN